MLTTAPRLRTIRKLGRGMALGPVLMVIAIAMMVAFTLAGTSIFHIRMAAHSEADMAAVDLAESALANTADHCMQNPQYGYGAAVGAVTYYPPSPHAGKCIVTFSTTTAGGCVNNNPPSGTTGTPMSVGGNPHCLQGPLPVGDVLIRATATVDGVERVADAIIEFPRDDYAILANGPITTTGNTIVAGVKPNQTIAQATAAANSVATGGPLTALGKGNIASNSTPADPDLTLQTGTVVTGKAIGETSISIGSNVRVFQMLPDQAPTIPAPSVMASNMDPTVQGSLDHIPTAQTYAVTTGPQSPPPPTGAWKLVDSANPTVNATFNAPLALSSSVIFAQGDLVVNGGVSGTGIIATTGNLTIQGVNNINAADNLALVTGGNLTITGNNASSDNFYGEVFCQGNFSASNITLAGSFIGNGVTSQMDVHSARLLTTIIPPLTITVTNTPITPPLPPTGGPTSMYPVYVGPGQTPINWQMYSNGQWGLANSPGNPPSMNITQFKVYIAGLANSYGVSPAIPTGANYNPNWTTDPAYHLADESHGGVQTIWQVFFNYEQQYDAAHPVPPPSGGSGGSGGGSSTSQSGGSSQLNFDPNKFLNQSENVHLLYWSDEP